MIVSGTGHRPDHIGGYGPDAQQHLVHVARTALTQLRPTAVISGMALGWDTALALATIEMDIPLTAAVPFLGQELRWSDSSQQQYHWILNRAANVHYVSKPGYAGWKMLVRNSWMNRRAGTVLALYDETKTTGGTAHCVFDALGMERRVVNAWSIYTGEHDLLTPIEPTVPRDAVCVFGSNLAGRHGAGQAKWCADYRGAITGQGVGRMGQCYALPTKDHDLKPLSLDQIYAHVQDCIEYARQKPNERFYVMPIGLGRAGYTTEDIAPMWRDIPDNMTLCTELQPGETT